jgi:HD-GYP domain-containing protein (c-di-GMP phosphodiesterase class II)
LPGEAATAVAALRLADTRMYESKLGGRSAAEAQTAKQLLQRLFFERHPRLGADPDGTATLAGAMAARLRLPTNECEQIRTAAAVRNVGKLAIPDSILNKAGALDSEEWAFIRRHTLIGERVLGTVPGLAAAARIVRSCHERPDGTGYPDGLAADAIPLASQIVAVCDAYSAMVSDRPYRDAMTSADALDELHRSAGTQFDATVVEAFVEALHAQSQLVAA